MPIKASGDRIRERREELELSQQAASISAGIALYTWQRAERGDRMNRITLRKIGRALDADYREFVEEEVPPKELART